VFVPAIIIIPVIILVVIMPFANFNPRFPFGLVFSFAYMNAMIIGFFADSLRARLPLMNDRNGLPRLLFTNNDPSVFRPNGHFNALTFMMPFAQFNSDERPLMGGYSNLV
jgi:hypothetical protein